MNCDTARLELLGYHWGEIDVTTRNDIEGHLSACSRCLLEYFALKRHLEMAEHVLRPTPELHRRVRAAVAQTLSIQSSVPRWRWWERPLIAGFGGLAACLALFATASHAVRQPMAPKDEIVLQKLGGSSD